MLSGFQSAALSVILAAAVAKLFSVASKSARKNAVGVSPIGLTSVADIFLLAFLTVAAMSLGLSASQFFYNTLGAENPLSVFVPTIILQFLIVAGVVLFKKFANVKFSLDFVFSKNAALAAFVFFAYSTIIVFLGNLLIAQIVCAATGEYPPKQEIVDIFSSMQFGAPTVLAILSIIIFAPIAEEMFFRGILYRLFKHFFAPVGVRFAATAAAILSGAMFALIHADIYVFFPLALMGICLCMVYEKSGSIVSAITVHMLFNALNVLIIAFVK